MLTIKAINALKPREKPYKVFDAKGLYLLVNKNGSRYWRFKYRFDNKERVLALGVFPDTGLKAARKKRDDARRLLSEEGIDPGAKRKADKIARKIAQAGSFKAVAEEWLEAGCPGSGRSKRPPSETTIRQLRQRLKKYVYPRIGHIPMVDIRLADLRGVITPISKSAKHETAHRIRSLCERIFGYAIATERADRNIATDIRFSIAPIPQSDGFSAILDPDKFGKLLQAIDIYDGQPTTMAALKLAPLVFVRPGELRAAEWSEFDLDARVWAIPDSRMKEGQPHSVPLSKQAVKIIREIRPISGRGKYLFPSIRSAKRPISDNTLNAALRRLGYSSDEHTTHGFRKSAATMLAEIGYNKEWIETQLAHKRPGVEGIYNKSHLFTQRKKMMQDWSDHLDRLKRSSN
jgi:integrase